MIPPPPQKPYICGFVVVIAFVTGPDDVDALLVLVDGRLVAAADDDDAESSKKMHLLKKRGS